MQKYELFSNPQCFSKKMPDFVCLPSPSARLHFAYGTATLCDWGLLQFESSPIETTETLRLEAAWSVGGCFGAKRLAWMRKTRVRDAFLEQSGRYWLRPFVMPFWEKRLFAGREKAYRLKRKGFSLGLPFHCLILSLSHLSRTWFGPHSALQALWPNELRMSFERNWG